MAKPEKPEDAGKEWAGPTASKFDKYADPALPRIGQHRALEQG